MNFLLLFSFSISLMVSPDNLARVGNLFGWNFHFAVVLILASAGVYFLLVPVIVHFHEQAAENISFALPSERLRLVESLFSILVKSTAMVFIAAGLMVSSGFAFNEIFVHQFPNFAFAFLLLFLLAFLQWLPERVIVCFQVFFSITVVAGMAVLIIKGLTSSGFQPFVFSVVPGAWSPPEFTKIIFMFLLLFIGFDLGSRFHTSRNDKKPGAKSGPDQLSGWLCGTVVLITAIYILWGGVAINHVNPVRLAESSISHLIAARTIWPSAGRYLMGGIIILGSCAAVNGLYFAVRKEIEAYTARYFLIRHRPIAGIFVTGCAGVTALLLAFGIAGYPALEVLISGSFFLWLLLYLLRLILSLRWRQPLLLFFKSWVIIALTGTILGVFVSSEDKGLLSIFLVIFLISLFTLSVMTEKISKRQLTPVK